MENTIKVVKLDDANTNLSMGELRRNINQWNRDMKKNATKKKEMFSRPMAKALQMVLKNKKN